MACNCGKKKALAGKRAVPAAITADAATREQKQFQPRRWSGKRVTTKET